MNGRAVRKRDAVRKLALRGLGHSGSLEMLRPGLLPTLRRIGSASAGGCNPFAGFGRDCIIISVEMAIVHKNRKLRASRRGRAAAQFAPAIGVTSKRERKPSNAIDVSILWQLRLWPLVYP